MDYTPQQQALLDNFDALAETLGSSKKAASAIGIKDAIISQLKAKKYPGNIDNQFAKLDEYFKTKEAAISTYQNVAYAPTSISEAVFETIRTCHIKGGFAIVTGDAGIGKTKAIKEYKRKNPLNAVIIDCNTCCCSVRPILKLLADELGVSYAKKLDDLWFAIAEKLHDGMVIIVDEAQHLYFQAIEALRAFSDLFDGKGQTLGVALVGNNGIREKIEGKSREMYRQINNRVWLRPFFQTKDVKREDIELIFPILKGREREITILYNVSRSDEGIRAAVRLFSNAYDSGHYDVQGLLAWIQEMKIKLPGTIT